MIRFYFPLRVKAPTPLKNVALCLLGLVVLSACKESAAEKSLAGFDNKVAEIDASLQRSDKVMLEEKGTSLNVADILKATKERSDAVAATKAEADRAMANLAGSKAGSPEHTEARADLKRIKGVLLAYASEERAAAKAGK